MPLLSIAQHRMAPVSVGAQIDFSARQEGLFGPFEFVLGDAFSAHATNLIANQIVDLIGSRGLNISVSSEIILMRKPIDADEVGRH